MAKSLAELRKEYETSSKESKGGSSIKMADWLSFQEGSNFVRILPGKDDPMSFFAEGAIHKYVISSEPYPRNYKCRRISGEKCPVCDFYFDLWKQHKALELPKGEKSKYGDLATKIKQKPRFYFTAVSRSLQEAGEPPVKLVAASNQLFDRVMKYLLNEDFMDDENQDESTIISLDRGNDFDIIMNKDSGWPNFAESESKVKKTKAGTPAQIAEWMDHNLDPWSHAEPDSYEKGVEIVTSMEAELNKVNIEDESSSGNIEV